MSNLSSLPPGFRFHPTDEELILHYLRNRAASRPCPVSIVAEVDIYKFDPWNLPAKAMFGDREWYFFSPRDRKYPNGVRPNRAAASGYWKATGTDKPIHTSKGNENIGVKKALVFYKGRPPKGLKTNWIMHEYRLAEAQATNNVYKPMKFRDSSMRLDDWVLCRIYKKSSHTSSIPPLMDREQEDSSAEDASYFTNLTNITQANPNHRMQKSFSVSEFLDDYSALSHMFDNMPEIPAGSEQGTLLGQPTSSQQLGMINGNNSLNGSSSSNLVQQLSQAQFPAAHPHPMAENSAKRPRIAFGYSEDGNGKLSDSCSYANISNQFTDSPQHNLLSQPFLSQQILLNSHLKSQ